MATASPARWTPSEAFERRILVKTNAPELLSRTLDPARLAGQPLVIGTATDPYQPAERRFRVTRRILEVLASYRGLTVSITTKSPLITRDRDVLLALSCHNSVTVNISLTTVDGRLARRLELRSPAPHARIRALARLAEAGIHAGLLVAPVVPGITDSYNQLARTMAAAREAGAAFVVAIPLRLGSVARASFLPQLAREFPQLVERYRHHFGRAERVSRTYEAALYERLNALQLRFGFPVRGGPSRGRRKQERVSRNDPPEPAEQTAFLV